MGDRRTRVVLGLTILAVALPVAWVALFSFDSTVVSDDGAYAITSTELRDHGSWSVPHLLQAEDRTNEFYPYRSPVVTERGYFLAPRHALWTAVTNLPARVLGDPGLRVLPAVGLATCVVCAALIADQFGHRSAAPLASLIALLSPLLFQSLQLWAHAFVAGAVSVGLLGALRVVTNQPGWAGTVMAVGGCTVAAAIRGDGFVFALAITGAVVLSGLKSWRSGDRSTSLRRQALAAFMLISSLLGYAGSIAAARSVSGSAGGSVSPALGDASSVGERLGALVNTVYKTPAGAPFDLLLLILVTCTLLGSVFVVRRGGPPERASLLVLLAGALFALRTIASPPQAATGLIGAWPVVLLLGYRPWSRLGPAERFTGWFAGIAVLGIGLTQYSNAGGFNWGGRFISPLVPALAASVAVALRSAVVCLPRSARFAPSVGVLLFCVFVAMLDFDADIRRRNENHFENLAEAGGPPVHITSLIHLPRLDWGAYGQRRWLRIPDTPGAVPRLLEALEQSGIREVTAYGLSPEHREALFTGDVDPRFVDTNDVYFRPLLVRVGGPRGTRSVTPLDRTG